MALPVLTTLELGAGAFSAIGFFSVALGQGNAMGLMGMLFAVKAIFFLFLGQRLAKDYAGAASLVPYFLLCAGGLYFHLQG